MAEGRRGKGRTQHFSSSNTADAADSKELNLGFTRPQHFLQPFSESFTFSDKHPFHSIMAESVINGALGVCGPNCFQSINKLLL